MSELIRPHRTVALAAAALAAAFLLTALAVAPAAAAEPEPEPKGPCTGQQNEALCQILIGDDSGTPGQNPGAGACQWLCNPSTGDTWSVQHDAGRDCYYAWDQGGSLSRQAAYDQARASGNPCPAATPSLPTVDELLEALELRAELPAPVLSVEPNSSGVVGMEVFLEIGGLDTELPVDEVFTLEIVDRSWDIDWGDGLEPQEGVRVTGGPYPDGNLTRIYDDRGVKTITVTVNWRIAWAVDPALVSEGETEGILLLTTSDSLDVTIREVQALRVR
jgi:hypothetical protein